MNFIRLMINQPVTVTVGVILIVMSGLIALTRIPIQLTPNVEDTVIAVTTRWEGASPQEIEQEIVNEQEDKLQGVTGLRAMTSESQQGQASIRLEFQTGTPKDLALREVSNKLREVPEYPENADEPVVEASDPENQDYIAWVVFGTEDPDFDIRTLQDFAEDNIKPVLERVPGMSEVNVLGGRERETQIRFDPVKLAQFGISPTEFVSKIQQTNRNVSAGEVEDAKNNVRLRTVSQYDTVQAIEDTVITNTPGGPVFVRDVAEVVETHKEPTGFVHSKGRPVIAINAQKEVGANVMEVMAGLKSALDRLRKPGGVLEAKSRELGLDSPLYLQQVYDQTIYIDDALALVESNIYIGGAIAIFVLLLFLRSIRSVGVVALAIPISVIGAVVAMVALGRSINVVSLAGMAFAIGMVVDNAIVVLENIFRHLEMGKRPIEAAFAGAKEVWGAILASTLTTIAVFIPILLIEEEAGQLFRDIALAICAAVALSLLVSITVIPTASGRVLKHIKYKEQTGDERKRSRLVRIIRAPITFAQALGRLLHALPEAVGRVIYWLCGSTLARVVVVLGLTFGSLYGSYQLMPPADYLPSGNRNLIFGMLIPPPGYNLHQQTELACRIEGTIEPFWEAGKLVDDPQAYENAKKQLPEVPTVDFRTGKPGPPVVPPPLNNYFLVSRGNSMFHGAISEEPQRIRDVRFLMQHATRSEVAPGVLAFAFQVPLFRTGGRSGSAVEVDLSGEDLTQVTNAATAVYQRLGEQFGFQWVQPSPTNFNIFGPELRVTPNKRRLADLDMTPSDLALAVQAAGDGAIIGDYRVAGESIDLKVITQEAVDRKYLGRVEDTPFATAAGKVVPLGHVGSFNRVESPPQINHVSRQRSVSLEVTSPPGLPLEQVVSEIDAMLTDMRDAGTIPASVRTGFAGSASKLKAVREALLGQGTFLSTIQSTMFLALAVVYLLMCVLFQSFLRPFVIMFAVPLATLGGFVGLFVVFVWSTTDPHLPVQQMDILTMLGFIILIGVVVNNAILIVHQALNFMRGEADTAAGESGVLEPRRAIAESVRTRVRPIFMSTMTSVGGMLPLVLMPGSGSELYRGLGSVVVGGLLVATIFTVLLVPLLLSLVMDLQQLILRRPAIEPATTLGGGSVVAGATRSRNGPTSV